MWVVDVVDTLPARPRAAHYSMMPFQSTSALRKRDKGTGRCFRLHATAG